MCSWRVSPVCLPCVWVISVCVTAPWVGLCVSLCLDPREHMGKPVVHPLGVCAKYTPVQPWFPTGPLRVCIQAQVRSLGGMFDHVEV